MSIVVNTSSFVNTPSTPVYQNWESSSPTQLIWIQTGSAVLFPFFPSVKIKDYIGTNEGAGYTQFRVNCKKSFINSTSSVDWLLVTSSLFSTNIQTTQVTEIITDNGLIDNLTISVQNLALLNVGVFELQIMYSIEGLNASGVWVELSNYAHVVLLNVYENEQVSWTPNNFILNHYQGTPFPEKEITMNGPSWSVTTPIDFILESADPSVTITTQISSYGTQYVASGNGEKIIKLKLNTYFNSPDALNNTPFNRSLTVVSGASTLVGVISFIVNVLSPGDFYVDPDALNFEATKGGNEPTAIDVFVFAENSYTISSPFWLIVSPTQEISPGNYSNLNVVPIASNNLSGGTYTGQIVLTSTSGGTSVSIVIPVTYVLHEFVSVPYSSTDFNFTKDQLFLNFFTQIPDTYFDVVMNVEVFDWFFQGGTSKTHVVPFKVPLFNKFQKENIGSRIEKMMAKYLEANTYATKQYNAANVSIGIKEKQYPTNELIRETTLNTIKFLSGVTPKNKVGNNAILELSNGIKRVTANSFDYINLMLAPGAEKAIEIFKNNESQEYYAIPADINTYKETIFFSNYYLKPGDTVEVKIYLDVLSTVFLSKKYIVYPEPEYSNMILWEDDYKMLQSYEFTGKHSVKEDFSYDNFTKKKNLIDYIKTLDVKKAIKLSINTGFIPKSDIIYIENILRGKRVWLWVSDDVLVELNNETKSIIYDDVDRELNLFDLEFTINKKSNEENYTF